MSPRNRLFAHRGDPVHAPENTVASYQAAVARGARAVEVDVRRAADGVWVVFHDAALKRTTGLRAKVAKTSWKLLKTADAGGWFSSQFRGEPIPRLSDLLRWCRSRRVALFLDVKVNSHEKELAQLLKHSGWLSQITIGAGKAESLLRWRGLLPKNEIFWVTGHRRRVTQRRVRQALGLKLTGIAAYRRWIDLEAVRLAQSANLKLYVWTAQTPQEIKRLVRLGVDGIMSEVWPHHLL